MPINIGGQLVNDIRIGADAVDAVYCGATRIYPSTAAFTIADAGIVYSVDANGTVNLAINLGTLVSPLSDGVAVVEGANANIFTAQAMDVNRPLTGMVTVPNDPTMWSNANENIPITGITDIQEQSLYDGVIRFIVASNVQAAADIPYTDQLVGTTQTYSTILMAENGFVFNSNDLTTFSIDNAVTVDTVPPSDTGIIEVDLTANTVRTAIAYAGVANYSGPVLVNTGGTMMASNWSVTNGVDAATVTGISITSFGSGTTYNSNLATDATTRRTRGTIVEPVTTFTPDGGEQDLTPLNVNVFAGTSFLQMYNETGTNSTTARTRTDTYTFVAGTNAAARNVVVTVTYKVPIGYLNADGSVDDTGNTVNQPGDTATTTANSNACGVLSAGNPTCTNLVTLAPASGPTAALREASRTIPGIGTLTLNVTDNDADNSITTMETVQFTATASSSYVPTRAITYAWTNVGTATGSFSAQSAMTTFTPMTTGTVIARCTASHTGDAGTTFTNTDDSDSIAVTAPAPTCGSTITISAGSGGGCSFIRPSCNFTVTSSTGQWAGSIVAQTCGGNVTGTTFSNGVHCLTSLTGVVQAIDNGLYDSPGALTDFSCDP